MGPMAKDMMRIEAEQEQIWTLLPGRKLIRLALPDPTPAVLQTLAMDGKNASEPRAGGRRIRMSPVRSRRTSSLLAVIGYHRLPPRKGGTCRRFNSRDTAL